MVSPLIREEDRASLIRRVTAMHRLWDLVVSDLTLEHVNHHERTGVLPIAFTVLHYVTGEDRTAADLLDAGPVLWDEYASRIRAVGNPPRRGTPIAEAEQVRVGDVVAWRGYQSAVFQRTETALEAISPERLGQPLFRDGPPPTFETTFLAMLVGPHGAPTVFDALEAWVYQHGIRHAGELEHARALVGLRGLT